MKYLNGGITEDHVSLRKDGVAEGSHTFAIPDDAHCYHWDGESLARVEFKACRERW